MPKENTHHPLHFFVEIELWKRFEKMCIDNGAKPGGVLRDAMLAMVQEHDRALQKAVDGRPLDRPSGLKEAVDRVLDNGDPQAQAAKLEAEQLLDEVGEHMRDVEELFEQLGEHDDKNRGNKYISFEEAAARKKQIELSKNAPGDDED